MKQFYLLILLIPFISISQTKIGNDFDGEGTDDQSGYSVSLSSSGSIVAIGAPFNDKNSTISGSGHVRIYQNISGAWSQIGSDIEGEAADDNLGYSVSLSRDGSIVAIGVPGSDKNSTDFDSGHVKVYQNILGVWTQIGSNIEGEASRDEFGESVSLSSDGSVVAIGSIHNDASSGHVRIYENRSGNWTQLGSDIKGERAGDESGTSVSLSSDGTVVAIGAPLNNDNGYGSGHVRIYEYESLTKGWTQIGIDIVGEAGQDISGNSVSLSSDGSIVAIGAKLNGSGSSSYGHVRVYRNILGTWTQIGSAINGEGSFDQSGFSVSLSSDGSMVAIGAHQNTDGGIGSGHVRIYRNTSGNWTQAGSDIDGEAVNDRSGFSVSLASDGSTVAIGAPFNIGSGLTNSGHVRVYDLDAVLSSDSFVLSQFRLYPNPGNNQITIELNKGLTLEKVAIYNNLGQFIEYSNKEIIDTSGLSTGLYYVEIITNKGKATKKLVIE